MAMVSSMNGISPTANPLPCSTVALTISARGLKDMDVFSKSDPMCVVYRSTRTSLYLNEEWKEIGRTETIMNTLNPEFTKQIVLDYFFEEKQPLRFEFYDIDKDSRNLESQEFLGAAECDLAEIVSVGVFRKTLEGLPGYCGKMIVSCEECSENQREHLQFSCSAQKLDKKSLFGKSDPFLKVYRINDDGSCVLVHKTEFVSRTLNPTWKPFELKLSSLCGEDRTRDFLVECWHSKGQFDPSLIGRAKVNVAQLLETNAIEVPLINQKKQQQKGSSYSNSGVLQIRTQLFVLNTFLDYVTGGTELEFSVAIDFTASNLIPSDPNSLHFLSNRPNQYEIAVRAVLEICQFYNRSKQFNAYGFGAIVSQYSQAVSHIFSLTNPQPKLENSLVSGVEGVMNAYHSCVRSVKFYGPTNFAPIISQAAKVASHYTRGAKYQVLLLVTDGAICDMVPTKKAIVEASALPMSIIIVGVGQADFSAMEELDGDNVRVSYNGRYAERDIVQFVPISNFLVKNIVTTEHVMAALAKEVLAELPLQLTSYMRSRNIAPLPLPPPREEQFPDVVYPKMEQNMVATAPPIDIPC